MQIIYGLDKARKNRKAIVASIGIFDGVHLGHQHLIKQVIRQARRLKAQSAIFTFSPHPLMMLNPLRVPHLLIFLRHRLRLISSLGIDLCLVLKFNRALANMPPEEFVRNLTNKFRIKKLLIGENFYFGKNKCGDLRLLKELGKKYNFKVEKIKIIKAQGKSISSTKIRQLVRQGKLNIVSKLLGRPVSILGTVTKGFARGRTLGFPTANINPHHEVLPPFGVYAVRVKINEGWHQGILNIGRRPTFFRDGQPSIEVHLFDFQRNIYGKDLEIIFLKKMRAEKRFKSTSALAQQIKKDVERVKKYFYPT